jgi:hypothetical protein
MADNAPFSANRAPFPNVHVNLPSRIETYILAFTGANGTATLLTSRSSGGVTVTYVSEGVYDFTFPAGGTGATGWILVSPPESAANTVAEVRSYALDSDLVNFATGAGRLTAVDGSATPAVADVIGVQVLVINVLRAAS